LAENAMLKQILDVAAQARSADQTIRAEAFSRLREYRDNHWLAVAYAAGQAPEQTREPLIAVLAESPLLEQKIEQGLLVDDSIPLFVWQQCLSRAGGRALSFVLVQVRSETVRGRALAAVTLGEFLLSGTVGAHEAGKATAALVRLSSDANELVAMRALESLRRIPRHAAPFMNEITAGLTDNRPNIRAATAATLISLGCRSKAVADYALSTATAEKASAVERAASLDALGHFAPTEQLLESLRNAAGNENSTISQSALRSIQRLGPKAAALDSDLLALLRNRKSHSSTSIVIEILSKREGMQTTIEPLLVECMQDDRKEIRADGLVGLGRYDTLGPASKSAVITLLGDSDPIVRRRAVDVLWRFRESDQDVARAIRRQLGIERDRSVRAALIAATQPSKGRGH